MPFDALWLSRAARQPLPPGTKFVECPNPKDCVANADVIITCSPIVGKLRRIARAERLKPGCLAIAVDDDPALDAATMSRAAVLMGIAQGDVMTGRLVSQKVPERNAGAWVRL